MPQDRQGQSGNKQTPQKKQGGDKAGQKSGQKSGQRQNPGGRNQ